PVDLEKVPHLHEGLKTYRPTHGRVPEFHPYGAELLVAHVEEVEPREGKSAERDRLLRRTLAEVHSEEVEDVEEGFPVRLALERLGDHGLEQLLCLPHVAERFEEPGGCVVASRLCIRPRVTGA